MIAQSIAGVLVLTALAAAAEPKPKAPAVPPPPPGMPPTAVKDAKPAEVYAADSFFEGPTWDPATGKLYFTSFIKGNQQILRLDAPGKATVWLDKTEGVNGTYLSLDGRLIGAQAYGHRVMSYKIGPDGPAETKILLLNPSLNQPNDLCQAPNGDIYFTDPDFSKRVKSAVWRLAPDGRAEKVLTDMPLPNGIKCSNDGKTLYIGDSHERHWKAYPIKPDGTVGAGKVLFQPVGPNKNEPDGFTLDEDGNLYVSGLGGVWMVSPDGKGLGFVPIPEFCTNVCFGGPEYKTLYITCSKKVYSLEMTVKGGRPKK